jgi:hypothetical protein
MFVYQFVQIELVEHTVDDLHRDSRDGCQTGSRLSEDISAGRPTTIDIVQAAHDRQSLTRPIGLGGQAEAVAAAPTVTVTGCLAIPAKSVTCHAIHGYFRSGLLRRCLLGRGFLRPEPS